MKYFKQSFSCVFLIFLMLASIASSAAAEEGNALSLVGSQGGPELTEGDTAGDGASDDAVDVPNAVNALTFYTDRTAFNTQFPGLPLEDFEEGNISPGGVTGCSSPLDENTNDACFVPGDILPGVSFSDNPGPSADGIALVGAGFNGAPSKQVVANYYVESFDIFFPNNDVYIAGMDLVCHYGSDTVNINIYGDEGALIGATTALCTPASSSFWGVDSDQFITRINISSPAYEVEGVDNVAFGGVPDLIVSSLAAGVRTYGTPMVRGVFANYMVTNQGSADAAASCLDFYLSRDSVLGAGDVYVGRENIAGLAAGNSYGRSVGYRLPSDKWQVASGTWRVIGVADACNNNDESDETNNQTSTVAGIVVK